MLNNKADFILEYNEASSAEPLKRQEVDWSQSRIIFIAPEFTRYQQYAIGFKTWVYNFGKFTNIVMDSLSLMKQNRLLLKNQLLL